MSAARARTGAKAGSPRQSPDSMPTLLDTGILVSLFNRDDPWHARVNRWLAGFRGELHTVEAVLTEASFFLAAHQRARLADIAAGPMFKVHAPDAAGHRRMATLMTKYADLDPDWADVSLVWLAEASGIDHIATVDQRDFGLYRIDGRRKFRLALI
ncbi:type II toxin-antitoxin system VapC family toxin [Leptothrix sp. BB-4]